jgi:hypothetical protein
MTADGKHLVGADGEHLCLAPDGVSLVDAGGPSLRVCWGGGGMERGAGGLGLHRWVVDESCNNDNTCQS